MEKDLFKELIDDTYQEMEIRIKPRFTEFNFIGSRGSGKTFEILMFLMLFFFSKKKNIIYIVRENHSELEELKEELFPKLESLGFKITTGMNGNFNSKKNTLSNGYNKIIFKALNSERMQVKKGKGAGLPVWTTADNIIIFYEEANQIHPDLEMITSQSLRGNKNTNIIKLYASNPWDPNNWFVKKCNKILPENLKELDTLGYQKRVYYDEEKGTWIYLLRNNILVNDNLAPKLRAELESYKEIDHNKWLIVARGMSGVLGDMVYANSLNKMKEFNVEMLNQGGTFFSGGIDWGYGSSSGASPSTAHMTAINLVSGIDVLDELTIWNNGEEAYTTINQIDMIIEFYRKQYVKYITPFKVYIDNAEGQDFYMGFNARLAKAGLTTAEVEFLPAIKPPISMRITLINMLISSGLLRIDTKMCPELINALNNCYYIEIRSNREGFKRERSHQHTHWINSGVEYSLGPFIHHFKESFSLLFK